MFPLIILTGALTAIIASWIFHSDLRAVYITHPKFTAPLSAVAILGMLYYQRVIDYDIPAVENSIILITGFIVLWNAREVMIKNRIQYLEQEQRNRVKTIKKCLVSAPNSQEILDHVFDSNDVYRYEVFERIGKLAKEYEDISTSDMEFIFGNEALERVTALGVEKGAQILHEVFILREEHVARLTKKEIEKDLSEYIGASIGPKYQNFTKYATHTNEL